MQYPPNQPSQPYPPQQPGGPGWPQQPQTPPPPPPMYTPAPGQMPGWQGGPVPPRPNGFRRFTTWYRRQKRPMQVIVGIGILVAVLFVGSAVVSGIAQSATATATPTANVQASQNQPTSAPVTPTPTPKPLTPTQQVAQIVQANATLDDKVESKFDASGVVVTETLSEAVDNNGYRLAMKDNCFNIEKALWQSGIKHLNDVEVNFLGPLVDAYGNTSTGAMGLCELKTATEAKFNWGNLDPDQAWNVYDTAIFSSAVQG